MKISSAVHVSFVSRATGNTRSESDGPSFAAAVAKFAAAGETATTAGEPPAVATDYRHMSRAQMQDAAKALYQAGDIDLDQLAMLQMAGPLGKVGPNGEFVPFTAAERSAIDSQPVDYIGLAQAAIKGLESRGQAQDPKSGYANWQQILAVLTEH